MDPSMSFPVWETVTGGSAFAGLRETHEDQSLCDLPQAGG